MSSPKVTNRMPVRVGVGFVAGAAIAAMDNYAFEGEVAPIVIVVMLFAVTAIAGGIWGRSGWFTSIVAWVSVPFPHLVKQIIGLPDTLHPNTYTSILFLAAFTFVVATIGTVCGVLIRRLTTI